MKARTALYVAAQVMGDLNAISGKTIGKRVTRRLLGRYTGKTMMRRLMGTTRHRK